MLDDPAHPKMPIRFWFFVAGTPRGGAPESIRAQWNGVALPVREPRPIEGPSPFVAREIGKRRLRRISDGVPVLPDDSLRALHLFDRLEAEQWWRTYFVEHPATIKLVFRTHEGFLVPLSYALAQHPELQFFDAPGD